MKAQKLMQRVRSEARHVWTNLADQYHHLEQMNNPAFVPYRPGEEVSEDGVVANGKNEARWSLLPVDSYEVDSKLMINIEIPGMELSDISITIEGNELVISGDKRKNLMRAECDKDISHEIAFGLFERRVALTGHRLKKTGHETNYEQGVLTISLPYDGDSRSNTVRSITLQ